MSRPPPLPLPCDEHEPPPLPTMNSHSIFAHWPERTLTVSVAGVLAIACAAFAGGACEKPDTEAAAGGAGLESPRGLPAAHGARNPDHRFASVEAMHAAHFEWFQSAPGFGMRRVLVMPAVSELTLAEGSYLVPKPDLLALEGTPAAYLSPGEMVGLADLTNRAARVRLQKRELTANERTAVAELRGGRDFVVLPATFPVHTGRGTNRVAGLLAVGAMRAGTGCARCHGCAEGALLGAFSYMLVPLSPPRTAPPRLAAR